MGMSDPDLSARRHRITFATSRTLAYVSVLELGTSWERTLRRAGIPLKYSQGFNPRPRMHFAAPLPVGCGSRADLLDLTLDEPWTSEAIARALRGTMPRDLTVIDTAPVADDAPALSELLVEAAYEVWLREVTQEEVAAAVRSTVTADALPLPKRGRRHRGKTYDLRPMILDLQVTPSAPAPWVGLKMRLEARAGATGRPDEVLKALNLVDRPQRCFRTALILQT
jgi:radical SAM-linked protein